MISFQITCTAMSAVHRLNVELDANGGAGFMPASLGVAISWRAYPPSSCAPQRADTLHSLQMHRVRVVFSNGD
jgi:hypothetical protein